VSAAFNPVITALERLTGALSSRHAVTVILAQILGGLVGVVVANLMVQRTRNQPLQHRARRSGRWLGEVVATTGLVLLITALSRTGRPKLIGWAVGAYITAGYWFASSTETRRQDQSAGCPSPPRHHPHRGVPKPLTNDVVHAPMSLSLWVAATLA
jgi:glycerol uptake facilitator-like aquaporin